VTVKEWVWKEQRKHHRCACGCGQFIKITKFHHSQGIPKFIRGHQLKGKNSPNYKGVDKWVSKNQNKHLCNCGCDEFIVIKREHYSQGIPKFIVGHNIPNYKKWVEQEQGKHFCQCGCGEEIIIKLAHHSRGIPNFIYGHQLKGEENPLYNGGRKATNSRLESKRRYLKHIVLNTEFKDSEAHHVDENYIINIPYKMHSAHFKGNAHNQPTGRGMLKMNKKAFKYLYENKENMLISMEEAFQINLMCVSKWSK